MVHIGNRIKEYRKRKGLSQKQLADHLNMTQQNIAYLEKNQFVSLDKVIEISNVLGVFPEVFLIDNGEYLLLEDKTPLSLILDKIERNLYGVSGLVKIALEKKDDSIILPIDNNYYEVSLDELLKILNQSFDLYKFLIAEKGSLKE